MHGMRPLLGLVVTATLLLSAGCSGGSEDQSKDEAITYSVALVGKVAPTQVHVTYVDTGGQTITVDTPMTSTSWAQTVKTMQGQLYALLYATTDDQIPLKCTIAANGVVITRNLQQNVCDMRVDLQGFHWPRAS
jgi:hypothetical protein